MKINKKKWSNQTEEIANYWNVHKRRNELVLKTGGLLKADLVNQLSSVFSDGTTIEKTIRRKRKRQILSLKNSEACYYDEEIS